MPDPVAAGPWLLALLLAAALAALVGIGLLYRHDSDEGGDGRG